MRTSAIVAALSLVIFGAVGIAQETTGNLEGIILDENGDPITNVEIVVVSPGLQGNRGVVTSQSGHFRLLELPAGDYRVEISHVGYQEVVYEDIPIRLGRTAGLGEIRLAERVIGMSPVVISGERPVIDPASTLLGVNFAVEDFKSLPIQRDYRSIVTLMPHANESFLGDETNVAGGTGYENKYFVDGVEATDPFRGLSGMQLPYNFIEETQMRAGAYEAEYRSSLGALVDVVTFSGGNELHGQIFGFLTNSRLTAEPRQAFDPAAGDYASYDFGFGVGGPIRQDKVWFHIAYNPSFENEDVDVPGQGIYEDRITIHRFAGKLTWRLNSNNSLALSCSGDPSTRRGVGAFAGTIPGTPTSFENPDPYLSRIDEGNVALSLRGTHTVNDAILLNTFVSRHYWQYRYGPETERGGSEILFIDAETGIWSGGVRSVVDNLNVVTTAGMSATFLSGRHTIKAGLEYKDNNLDFIETHRMLVRYADDYFRYGDWIGEGIVANRIPSAYIQDGWRIQERLRMNAGLRWDGQYLIGSNGEVAQKILDQWQPRVGFTYQPGNIGTHKIYGSYGRFFQELSSSVVQSYYVGNMTSTSITYDHDPRYDWDPTYPVHETPDGDSLSWTTGIQPEINGLEGQYYDEFTLGYEREVLPGAKVGLRGIYRKLGQALEDGLEPGTWYYEFNNPGKGHLSAFPGAEREYTALELSFLKSSGDRSTLFLSYVLSRTYGNYTGLFDSDLKIAYPNYGSAFDVVEQMENSTGLLPNDRTHVFKLSGSYRIGYGITTGGSFSWMTGTPKNEWGALPDSIGLSVLLGGRGAAGRMPSLWDLNLRFSYELPGLSQGQLQPRLIVDIFHLGSEREAVDFVQVHYYGLDEDGNQTDPNPWYGRPTRHQPPTAVRLGLEVYF